MDTVSPWHPWQDKPGTRHPLGLWDCQEILQSGKTPYYPSSADDCVQYIGRNRLYVLCRDILCQDEFPYSDELLGHPKTEPYLQKQGKVVAMRLQGGRYSGFLIPSRTWNHPLPGQALLEDMEDAFHLVGYQGITPGSTSEKVLRSTLPKYHSIYRPSVDVRRVLLATNGGGRIDESEFSTLYPHVYTYDIKSAYLYFSRSVPSPFKPPYFHIVPDLSWVVDYPVGYWLVTMQAGGEGVHPVFLEDREHGNKCGKRYPLDGEVFTRWLWSGTIRDCIEHGYTLLSCERGYRWEELSDFMAHWGDILYDAYQKADRDTLRSIIKSMWVSLPGRFLKQPYSYQLIGQQEVRKGDIPIPYNWFHTLSNWQDIDVNHPPKFLTNWYVRAEYDQESTALTPIGTYIVEECRREIYRLMREEELQGNTIVGSYIDSVSFSQRAAFLERIGVKPGDLKEEIGEEGWAEMNRFLRIVDGKLEARAPGFSDEKRLLLLKKFWQIVTKQRDKSL